jgi:hypothetical protein
MKSLVIILGMLSITLNVAGSVDTISSSDNLIEYTGRIDFTNTDVPVFSYSGVSIRARFTGTSIGIIMNDNTGNNYYNIILDGRLLDTLRITTGKKIYPLAEGLENTTHEIEIFKLTEEMFGKTQFYGFVVDIGSNLLSLANSRPLLIEYIGNSITCGYGNEGIAGETFGPTTENHYQTYAAITSRNFNARHLAVCKSGIGIYRNYNGPPTGNTDCMTNRYTRIFLNDENPKYAFKETPDLVCIDLGTNDYSTTGGDSARYVSNYFRMIDTIQTRYTMPDILCLLGPMMSDPTLTQMRKYLQFIADSASKKGKGYVYFFEMSTQTGPFGIDYHPTVAQHQKNGSELTAFIKNLKGWKVNPLIVSAVLSSVNHIQANFNTAILDTINTFSGFTVYANDQECGIDSVYRDLLNNYRLHIVLQKNLTSGDKISLSYEPGTLISDDTVAVASINKFDVANNLSETKITRGSVNTDGASIIFFCNKNINTASTIEGLTIQNKLGDIFSIKSFSILNALLTVYLNDTIQKSDTVYASYSGNKLSGIDEIPVSSFSGLEVKNYSKVTGVKTNYLASLCIYPNPNTKGIFKYQLDKTAPSGNINLSVLSSSGELIYQQSELSYEGVIDIQKLVSEGIYFLEFTANDIFFTKQVIIIPE